jgi:acyl-CoA thioesterase-1
MKPTVLVLSILTAIIAIPGCDRDDSRAAQPAAAPHAPPATTTPATADAPRVVFLGDSLTAGLGVEAAEAFPALLGQQLIAENLPNRVVNAGVSGDTTAGGLRRLDWLLRQSPDILVVGLGGNDGLRGLDVRASEENLRAIVRRARDAGADVLLLGMLIPPNYGPEYTTQFREIYPKIAREFGVPLVPFLLENVGGDPRLNQPDGIHPTAEGHKVIARTVLPHLRPLLRSRAETSPSTRPTTAP